MSEPHKMRANRSAFLEFHETTCSDCGHIWTPQLPPKKQLVQNNNGAYIRCPECRHINHCDKKQNYE